MPNYGFGYAQFWKFVLENKEGANRCYSFYFSGDASVFVLLFF